MHHPLCILQPPTASQTAPCKQPASWRVSLPGTRKTNQHAACNIEHPLQRAPLGKSSGAITGTQSPAGRVLAVSLLVTVSAVYTYMEARICTNNTPSQSLIRHPIVRLALPCNPPPLASSVSWALQGASGVLHPVNLPRFALGTACTAAGLPLKHARLLTVCGCVQNTVAALPWPHTIAIILVKHRSYVRPRKLDTGRGRR